MGDAGNIIADGRNITTQGISGTGALRIGSAFLAKFSGGRPVYLPRVSKKILLKTRKPRVQILPHL